MDLFDGTKVRPPGVHPQVQSLFNLCSGVFKRKPGFRFQEAERNPG